MCFSKQQREREGGGGERERERERERFKGSNFCYLPLTIFSRIPQANSGKSMNVSLILVATKMQTFMCQACH